MSPRQGLVRGTLTYLRRDLREIVAPTSLPDDAKEETGDGDDGGGIKAGNASRSSSSCRGGRFTGRLRAAASGVSDYCDSWKKPLEATSEEAERAHEAISTFSEDAALLVAAGDARDDLASASRQAAAVAAAVTGSEALRPALRNLYRTRAAAYRDAVFSFVEGYREGVSGAVVVDEEEERERDCQVRPPTKEKETNKETTTPLPNDEKKR